MGLNGLKMRSVVEVLFPTSASLDSAIQALSHEGKIKGKNRANVKLEKCKIKGENLLKFTFAADDVVALRSATNAYLRALQIIEAIESNGSGSKDTNIKPTD